MTSDSSPLPVVVIFGPTGVGKTDLLGRLFRSRAEVISADSMQVYRGMDVGTAKPSPEELNELPHHLIDIKNPDQQFSAGDFVRETDRLVREISSRGKVPVVSGGTAFYLKTWLYGLPDSPPSDAGLRDALRAEYESGGIAPLVRELAERDPVSAARIDPRDTYRVLRALEVSRLTGRPLSSYRVPDRPRTDIAPLLIGLDRDREVLARRIELRVRRMFERGLAEEAKGLMKRFRETDPGMQAIGYREFYLMPLLGCAGFREIEALIATNTRKYAKRQLTFFRSIPGVVWRSPDETSEIASLVERFFIGS